MISCLLRIHSLRFFDGGLHEVPVEEVMTVALIAIFIFVPCLWLVRYLKDKRLDSDEKDKFIQIHIISTIVLTIAGGVFARMSGLVNKWIDEQPLIIAVYIALALSFGCIVSERRCFKYLYIDACCLCPKKVGNRLCPVFIAKVWF